MDQKALLDVFDLTIGTTLSLAEGDAAFVHEGTPVCNSLMEDGSIEAFSLASPQIAELLKDVGV